MSFVEPLLALANIEDRAGNWPEALVEYDKALLRLRQGGGPHTAAEIFRRIGKVHWSTGNFELAEEAFITCIAISEACEILDTLAAGLNSLAVVTQFTSGSQEAEALYVRALSIVQQTGDTRLAAMIWQNLGTLASVRGEAVLAIERYQAALTTYESLGDSQACGWAHNNLGMVHLDLGRLQEASAHFARAGTNAERAGDESLIALVHMNQVEMHIATGALVPARACCGIAGAIFERLGARARLAEVHKWYGVLDRTTNTDRAQSHFSRAFELAVESGDRLLQAEIESERAGLYEAAGRHRDAVQSLTRAGELFAILRAGKKLEGVDRRLVKVEEAYLAVVKRWGESIEAKDAYTSGHCERVARYACALAQAIGVPERELSWIYLGAFLHDVGKISVSTEILNKAGPLTEDEWTLLKDHPALGASIVAQMDLPWDIRPLVRHHHEHWDGGGYPDGLSGDDIPLVARIVCLADAFDALTSTRSYQAAVSQHDALVIMEREVGSTFDPELFDTFLRLVESGRIAAPAAGAAMRDGVRLQS